MARSTDCGFRISDCGFLRLLGVLGVLAVPLSSARADDRSTLLSAPQLPPYKWFASTDPKNQNADYVLLKPGETRRVPLASGVLLRLWSTAFEPEKITLAIQNGVRVEVLKGGKAALGNYYEKAFTLYPDASTPATARSLKTGAALVVTNGSKNENKWFYQATVRSGIPAEILTGLDPKASKPNEEKIDWDALDDAIKTPAQQGKKLLTLPGNATSAHQLFIASGSARSQKGKPIPILKVQGQGAFVGLVLDIRPAPDTTRRTFAFLEGNETITADGNTYEGTGTEDFFNSAWYYPEKPFAQKYHGVSLKTKEPPRVTAYRWLVRDPIPFKKNFVFDFEHGNGSNSNDLEYRWVAFWYQKPGDKFQIADELKGGASTPTTAAAGENQNIDMTSPFFVTIFAALAGALLVGTWLWYRRARR